MVWRLIFLVQDIRQARSFGRRGPLLLLSLSLHGGHGCRSREQMGRGATRRRLGFCPSLAGLPTASESTVGRVS